MNLAELMAEIDRVADDDTEFSGWQNMADGARQYIRHLEALVRELAEFESPDRDYGQCAWDWDCEFLGAHDDHTPTCPVTRARALNLPQTEA